MKKIIVAGIGIVLLWNCNNNPDKSTPKKEAEVHAEHHGGESSLDIELNNGEKWKVNEEMKPFVQNGAALVSTYIQNKQTDYKTLADQLSEQNNQLIKSCTMTGKSHDELHKWLHPHLQLVEALKNSTNDSEAKRLVRQLEDSYLEYQRYFQ